MGAEALIPLQPCRKSPAATNAELVHALIRSTAVGQPDPETFVSLIPKHQLQLSQKRARVGRLA